MRERPILFSTPMVQAILEGRKSMTRRVVKDWLLTDSPNYFDENSPVMNKPPHRHDDGKWYYELQETVDSSGHYRFACPYGVPGDRLWARETWVQDLDGEIFYRADHVFPAMPAQISKWRPSIHMPRAASRITLEITDIRVERVQDIKDEDVLSEGFRMNNTSIFSLGYKGAFEALWDSINAKKHPWESNPWVWAISFRRVQA